MTIKICQILGKREKNLEKFSLSCMFVPPSYMSIANLLSDQNNLMHFDVFAPVITGDCYITSCSILVYVKSITDIHTQFAEC